MGEPVIYIDIGYNSAREFWDEIVLASAGRFETQPTRAHAMACAIYLSYFLDWVFHERHPGQAARGNPDYVAFRQKHHVACPELSWLADLADVAKHRGLGRRTVVLKQLVGAGVRQEGAATDELGQQPHISESPIELEFVDGTRHRFDDVVDNAIAYWRANR